VGNTQWFTGNRTFRAIALSSFVSNDLRQMDEARTATTVGITQPEKAQAESRKYPRCQPDMSIVVAWDAGGSRLVSRVTTVGMGGLFIHTPNPPKEGTTLKLLFDLPNGEVRARAVVRNRKAGEGMGIQFVELRPECRARLNELMKRLLG
jgi:hypothetical protein